MDIKDINQKDINQKEKYLDESWYENFVTSQTEADAFPFAIWVKILRNLMQNRQKDVMMPSPTQGIIELRKAIADELVKTRGLVVSPEQIVVGSSSEYLYSVISRLIGSEKIYALEDPGYANIGEVYELNHIKKEYIPVDQMGMRVEKLTNSEANVAIVSPSHQFPTGAVMSLERRYDLLEWVKEEKNRYIIEDDYDNEFLADEKKIPSLKSLDMNDRTIYMNTFSRTLSSTIRFGYIVLPPQLMDEFHAMYSFMHCTVSNFEQYTLATFLKEGHFDKQVERLKLYFEEKQQLFLRCFEEQNLSDYVKLLEYDAGLQFLVEVKDVSSDVDFVKICRKEGIHIKALSSFYHKPPLESKHLFLIKYSGVSEHRVKEAISRISKILLEKECEKIG